MSSEGSLTSEEKSLLARAQEAGRSAYCPYSHFRVGAAVATELGVFTGCNIENASYGLSVCAERVALFQAVAHGAKRFTLLAVSCLDARESASEGSRMPCGACRQVIAEFLTPETIVLVDGVGRRSVAELLPHAFRLSGLEALAERT